MSKKIYLSGGLILVEEAGKNTETFNINSTDFTLSGDQISLVDNITKQAANLGAYTGLTDVDDASFASLALASTYIENLFRPISVIVDLDGNAISVNASNQLKVVLDGLVVDNSSTSTPLGIGGVFTGVASETLDYALIFVSVKSDVASATDGLVVQQSPDGTNWDLYDNFTIPAGIGKTFSFQTAEKYFRVVYTNGGTEQSYMRLQSIVKKTNSKPSSHRIQDMIIADDDAELVKSVLTGLSPAGNFTNVNVTNGQNLKISLEEYDVAFTGDPLPVRDPLLEISRDNVTDESSENKYGRNTEIDSGVTADVWDGGHTVASGGTSLIWLAPTAARIHTIASTSANDDTGGTGANSVRINYLPDWDTEEAIETVTGDLNAGIAMISAAVIINRMEVIMQSTSTIINDGEITATAAVDGTITARIRAGKGQTQMAIYGVPSTQKLRIGRLYANVNKAGGAAGLLDITLLANTAPNINTIPFTTKHTFGLQTVGTSAFTIPYYVPKKISGPAIVKIQASSNTNDMDVSAGIDFAIINN